MIVLASLTNGASRQRRAHFSQASSSSSAPIHALQVGQRILWYGAVSLADDDASRRAVLSLVSHITRYFEVALTQAAEVYLEVEQLLAATDERLRRDTLEDLLAGAPIAPGPPEQAVREAGLERDRPCLVISAEPLP